MSDQVNNNVYIKPEDLEKMRHFTSGINTLPLATLRDQFAMAALTGITSIGVGKNDGKGVYEIITDVHASEIAKFSYLLADEMLKARGRHE